jgi:hypothetical protein
MYTCEELQFKGTGLVTGYFNTAIHSAGHCKKTWGKIVSGGWPQTLHTWDLQEQTAMQEMIVKDVLGRMD